MDLSLLDIFKKKPAAPSTTPAAPPPTSSSSKPSQTELRNRMLVSAIGKKYEPGGAPGNNGARTASVTADSNGRIVAVDEHCTPMFGWKGQELIGQHLKVLLREGSENHLAALLQPQRGQDSSSQLLSLRVVARRMDGREFSASVTRLTWTPEAPVRTRNMSLHLHDCWTAVFRELTANDAIVAAPTVPVDEGRNVAPVAGRLEDAPQFQGSPATLRSANQELQRKLEAMSVEAYRKSEALLKAEKERQELARQLQAQDAELKTAHTSLEQERKRFEAQLQHLTSAKANLDKQSAERNKSKDEVRTELLQAKLAVERAEAARQQETARADGFKQALANLQQGHDTLNARVAAEQHAAADARRKLEELESVLRGTSAEAERTNAELEKRIAERSRLEAEWQEQVKIAKTSVERTEAGYKQEATRADRLERELMNLRHGYDAVSAKLTSELQTSAEAKRRVRELEDSVRESAAEAERAKALVQKNSVERNRIGSEWQDQVESVKAAVERAEAAHKQEAQRAARLERDLASLRQGYDEMEGKLATEQRAAAEARRRVKEVETQLRDNTAELERAFEERQKHSQGRGAAESELRAQLHAAKGEAGRIEANLREKMAQSNRLEQEVANLRLEHDELQSKYKIEKDAGTKAKRRIKQLEKLAGGGASTKRRKASAKDQPAERAETSEPSSKELDRLREKEAAHAAELSELERRIREGVTSLTRVTAEVDKERGERRRSEERFAALSDQLQQMHSELKHHLDSDKVSKT